VGLITKRTFLPTEQSSRPEVRGTNVSRSACFRASSHYSARENRTTTTAALYFEFLKSLLPGNSRDFSPERTHSACVAFAAVPPLRRRRQM
jgi:hypothetical protein